MSYCTSPGYYVTPSGYEPFVAPHISEGFALGCNMVPRWGTRASPESSLIGTTPTGSDFVIVHLSLSTHLTTTIFPTADHVLPPPTAGVAFNL